MATLEAWWRPVGTAVAIVWAVLASTHVVLNKRDVRSAAGWVGLIWLVPWLGAVLYLLLGINRIRRRALILRKGSLRARVDIFPDEHGRLAERDRISNVCLHLADLSVAIGSVTGRGLLGGNRVVPLVDGDAAYPVMLEAIRAAKHSVAFATYIFETKGVGGEFVEALSAAQARGVEVRVLVDDVGARYASPRARSVLKRRGVRVAHFMPARSLLRAPYFNLRNHRKILVVDGSIGFTGGMNIREGHVLANAPRHPVRDLHFRIDGPVVAHLMEVFAQDWEFTTHETLEGERWFPVLREVGSTLARGISDGPDEDLDRFTWTLQAALACAHRSVTIMTPYFLPDNIFHFALSTSALRGVEVNIVLPERSNLLLVQWAMWRQLEEVLGHGVRVWLTPPPFDHTKLMLVDNEWVLFGSANWDARSMRLNFELNVECYDRDLCEELTAHVSARISEARELTLGELRARSFPRRVRDSFVRLLMPYL